MRRHRIWPGRLRTEHAIGRKIAPASAREDREAGEKIGLLTSRGRVERAIHLKLMFEHEFELDLTEAGGLRLEWRSITKSRKAPKETDNGKRRLAANEGL